MNDPAPASDGSKPVPLSRIVALAWPERYLLAVATVALFIGGGLGLVYPQAAGWLIDEIVQGGGARLDEAALILIILFAVQSVFSMARAWLFTVAGERVVARLREQLYRAIIGQDIGFFDQSRTGELTNRLASDTTVIQNAVTVNVSMAVRFTMSAIGGAALMLYMSPTLAGVSVLVVPVVAVGASIYGRWMRTLSKAVQDALAASTEVAEETFQSVRTVRSFAREDEETARYAEKVQESYELAAKRALAYGAFQGALGFAGYAAVALVVWFGGAMVVEGTMTIGELTSFLFYTLLVAMSLGALSGLYGDFMKASGASQRVFQLLDQKPDLEGPGGSPVSAVDGVVELDDVHFVYPTRPDTPVMRGLSLRVEQGEAVALVGHSGSGKSTIASLVSRFYDPTEGSVRIDGRDLRELDPRSLREHIGMVAQEPVLFAASIADNIRYGRPLATDDDVRRAAAAANALDFIEGFPDGFDTQVGERGVRLSGGQKQRIAIARAVLKDPAILILDEATSALDAESEHVVQEALDRLMEGRTTFVIAHRLSTVRDADRVAVLDHGVVAEQGTHDELLARGGLYRKLVERQFADGAADLLASAQ